MHCSLNNMNSVLDKHAPLKKLININENLRQNPGLLLHFRNLLQITTPIITFYPTGTSSKIHEKA